MILGTHTWRWPEYWPRHYKALVVHLLTKDHKIKWQSSTQIKAGRLTISAPDLEDIVEDDFLWPDHQRIINQILTMADESS